MTDVVDKKKKRKNVGRYHRLVQEFLLIRFDSRLQIVRDNPQGPAVQKHRGDATQQRPTKFGFYTANVSVAQRVEGTTHGAFQVPRALDRQAESQFPRTWHLYC